MGESGDYCCSVKCIRGNVRKLPVTKGRMSTTYFLKHHVACNERHTYTYMNRDMVLHIYVLVLINILVLVNSNTNTNTSNLI